MNSSVVAIVGTNGIPAKYGGFETLAEYLVQYLGDSYKIKVYCSKTPKNKRLKCFKNADLIYLPFKANGWQSVIYDLYALFHAAFCSDIILYLGPAAGYILPLVKLFSKNIVVNHGGLNEWERTKFTKFQKRVIKINHCLAARYATINIADNFLLRDNIKKEFGVDSIIIRYGGDHAKKVLPNECWLSKYSFLKYEYYVNVSRAQIDNNIHLVLNAFKSIPNKKIVIISNWSVSEYGIKLKEDYKDKFPNIILLDSIYEIDELNVIRSNAKAYIHSHSFCGTAPSLVEAMAIGLPIICFDVPTNRETTKNQAFMFKDSEDLEKLLYSLDNEKLNSNKKIMKSIADNEYTWDNISSEYSKVFDELK